MVSVPAAATVTVPPPVSVPPVQVNWPLTVMFPASVLPGTVRFSVCAVPVKSTSPRMLVVPVTLYVPPTVELHQSTCPAPVTLLADVSVCPSSPRSLPAATLNEPLLVPPPSEPRLPLCTCTLPLLLNVV